MKIIKSYLPIFPGFYSTSFDSDNAEENTIYNLVEEEGLDITDSDIDFNFKEYKDRIALSCIGSIEDFLKHDAFSIEIKFEKIYSPKEYNFSNDVIYCTYKLDNSNFDDFISYAKDNLREFKSFIIEKYSSRSGFSSFFDTDLKTWFNEYLDEDSDKFERAFTGLLEFYLKNEGYSEDNMLSDCDSETSCIDYKFI